MKIIRFAWGDRDLYGILEGDTIYSLHGDIFGEFQRGREKCRLEDVRVLSPVQPGKIAAIGLNYPRPEPVGEPGMFLKVPTCVVGPGDPIVYPPVSHEVVLEAELAIVMKAPAKNVSPSAALSYVLGYTCANDMTARDITQADGRPVRGKIFDTFCPLGPVMETELDPGNLAIRSCLNGQLVQDASTSMMIIKVPDLISRFSQVITLLPGDVILTGTPHPPWPVSVGDTIEVEIEGIGVLRNPVAAP